MAQKSIPLSWVKEKNNLLKEKLFKDIQQSPFYPDAYFYAQYYNDHLKGLHYMAMVLFSLLKISPNGCVIDFYDEKDIPSHSGDTAGFYTKFKNDNGEEKELIFINSKHKNNPLAVGAILAHEMMHLYLFRLGLKLEDTQENELLTDLATINTGFSILILNGMHYSSKWWLTIILIFVGIRYWSSQQLSFGYFKPKEYGKHSLSYFKEHNLYLGDIIGYINPTSRHFVANIILRLFTKQKKESTEFIKILEKQHLKSNIIKGIIPASIIAFYLITGLSDNNQQNLQSQNKQNLSVQIQTCKSEISILENKIDSDLANFKKMESQIIYYENIEDVENYNNLVTPYNSLSNKLKVEISEYEARLASCNNLIGQYNKKQLRFLIISKV